MSRIILLSLIASIIGCDISLSLRQSNSAGDKSIQAPGTESPPPADDKTTEVPPIPNEITAPNLAITAIEVAAGVIQLKLDASEKDESQFYCAVKISSQGQVTWLGLDGSTVNTAPVWGKFSEFGGANGMTVEGLTSGDYTLAIALKSKDGKISDSSATFAVSIKAEAPSISYSVSNLGFTQGTAVSTVALVNSGGKIESCAVTPDLPTGLTLSAQCVISGTAIGVSSGLNYSIIASNTFGSSEPFVISIEVKEALPEMTYALSTYTFSQNVAIATITPTTTGGSITACEISPAIPAGLALSSSCVITGTPTTVQTATTYAIVPKNGSGDGPAVSISITVLPPKPVLNFTGSPFTFVKGTAAGMISPVNSGGAVTSCSATPNLPSGLTLSTSCVLSGTPTEAQAASDYMISSSNAGGTGDDVQISITVLQPAPTISYSGSPYTFTIGSSVGNISAANTGGTISSCASDPNLPDGLTLSSTCAITGTPTTEQTTTNYDITATNGTGDSAPVTISIKVLPVLPAISYSTTSLVLTKNQTMSTVTASSSAGPVTSCSSDPELPSGLTLSNSCAIAGTPTTVQNAATYEITPSNAAGNGPSVEIEITVEDVLSVIAGEKETTTNLSIGASSSGTPITMSAADGLPNGPTLMLWQADATRTWMNTQMFFRRNGVTEYLHRNTGSSMNNEPYMGFKYFPSVTSDDTFDIHGVTGTGATLTFTKAKIAALDLSAATIYQSITCGSTISSGNNSNICVATSPNNKSGQTWLFLATVRASQTTQYESFTFFPQVAIDGQVISKATSHNVSTNRPFEITFPFTYKFLDNTSKNIQFSYSADLESDAASTSYAFDVVGIDLTNVGQVIDETRTPANGVFIGYGSGYEAITSKTLSLPETGKYLVLTRFQVESPNYEVNFRTKLGGTTLQSHQVTGGGSGIAPFITTYDIVDASAGSASILIEVQKTDEDVNVSGSSIVILLK